MPSIILCNITSNAPNYHTDIYPLSNINIYIYVQRVLVVAKGSNEFAQFVSKGILTETSPANFSLTLARRYLPTKGDVRTAMDIAELISPQDLLALADAAPLVWVDSLPVKISKKEYEKQQRLLNGYNGDETGSLSNKRKKEER